MLSVDKSLSYHPEAKTEPEACGPQGEGVVDLFLEWVDTPPPPPPPPPGKCEPGTREDRPVK